MLCFQAHVQGLLLETSFVNVLYYVSLHHVNTIYE